MGIQGLDFQNVEVRFTGGLDTRTNPKLVIPSKWRALTNVSLTDDGTPKPRDGISQLSTQSGNGLFTNGDQLCQLKGPGIYSYSVTESAWVGATSGYGFVDVSYSDVYRLTNHQDSVDVAIGDGFICYVWREFSSTGAVLDAVYRVFDSTTGTFVAAGSVMLQARGPQSCRVVFSGHAFFCFAIGTAVGPGILDCVVVQTSGSTITPGAITTLLNTANLPVFNFDAIDVSNGAGTGNVLVALTWNDGTTSTEAYQVGRAGTVPATASNAAVFAKVADVDGTAIEAITCLQVSATISAVFVMGRTKNAGVAAPQVIGRLVDTTAGYAVSGAVVVVDTPTVRTSVWARSRMGACLDQTGAIRLFYDQAASYLQGFNLDQIRQAKLTSVLGITSVTNLQPSASYASGAGAAATSGPYIWGKPFNDGTTTFLPTWIVENWATTPANTAVNNAQTGWFLLNCDTAPGTVVAKALYGNQGVPYGYGISALGSGPTSVINTTAGVYLCPSLVYGVLMLGAGIETTNTGVCALTLTPRRSNGPPTAQLGRATFLAGGSLTSYSGIVGTEAGFYTFPEGIFAQAAAGAGMTAGAHQVVAVYEWLDEAGQFHQSAPSPAVSVTTGGGTSQITVTVPTLLLGARKGTTTIVLYCTAAAGTIFYRTPSTAANTTAALSVNMPALTLADTVLTANGLLYSQPDQAGTTLPNDSPPPCSTVCLHQNRLFFDVRDAPGVYGYSQPWIEGHGLQFNEALQGRVPSEAGRIVALAEMDEKVLILCEKKIYAIFGTGPTSSGAYNNYSDPIEVPGDVGCSEARSVLKPTGGVIFKSTIGWHEVGRDLTVRYIGEAVKAYDSQTVKSAVLVADRKEARFECSEVTLVYSYLYGQWSTFTYLNYGVPVGIAAADSLYWAKGGYYVRTTLAVGVHRDMLGQQYDDYGGVLGPLILTLQTAWLKLARLTDFQRIQWLYLTMTEKGIGAMPPLAIAVDYDYGDNQAAPGAYTIAGINLSAMTSVGSNLDVRHKLRHQKCEAVAFTFTFNTGNGSVATIGGIQGLSLRVGFKRGTNKLPATNAVG